jgi:DUF1707 SHOCT-like domain
VLEELTWALLYCVFWLTALGTIVAFPIWLSVKAVAAMRRRAVVPWRTRVGDRERAAVARRLRDDYATGRLDLPELEARTDATLGAATYRDLRAIAADLPPPRPLRAFGLLDLALAFVAGLAGIAVNPSTALLLLVGILLRRRLA